jgi:hypothetical protein
MFMPLTVFIQSLKQRIDIASNAIFLKLMTEFIIAYIFIAVVPVSTQFNEKRNGDHQGLTKLAFINTLVASR